MGVLPHLISPSAQGGFFSSETVLFYQDVLSPGSLMTLGALGWWVSWEEGGPAPEPPC